MPYTRGWNDGTPAGSRAASQIDDAIREFKVDLHERMDSTFAVDWLADPVVAKENIVGKVTGRIMMFGPHIFFAHEDQDDVGHIVPYVEQGADCEFMLANPYLPHGITVQKLELIGDKNGSINIEIRFSRVAYLTGAETIIDTAARSAAGIGLTVGANSAVGNLGHIVDSSVNHYIFRLDGTSINGNVRLYGVRLTVDVPNHLAAV